MLKQIDMSCLKSFATAQLKEYPLLRQMILEEAAQLSQEEFAMKCKMWLQVLAREMEAR